MKGGPLLARKPNDTKDQQQEDSRHRADQQRLETSHAIAEKEHDLPVSWTNAALNL
jgi:hypothetical protein